MEMILIYSVVVLMDLQMVQIIYSTAYMMFFCAIDAAVETQSTVQSNFGNPPFLYQVVMQMQTDMVTLNTQYLVDYSLCTKNLAEYG